MNRLTTAQLNQLDSLTWIEEHLAERMKHAEEDIDDIKKKMAWWKNKKAEFAAMGIEVEPASRSGPMTAPTEPASATSA